MYLISTAKEIIGIAIVINTIVDNYPKFKKIYELGDTIAKPLIKYINTCRCSVCEFNRKHNLNCNHY